MTGRNSYCWILHTLNSFFFRLSLLFVRPNCQRKKDTEKMIATWLSRNYKQAAEQNKQQSHQQRWYYTIFLQSFNHPSLLLYAVCMVSCRINWWPENWNDTRIYTHTNLYCSFLFFFPSGCWCIPEILLIIREYKIDTIDAVIIWDYWSAYCLHNIVKMSPHNFFYFFLFIVWLWHMAHGIFTARF